MGEVVKFPEEGRIVRFGRPEATEDTATIIILPVIRVERHTGTAAEEGEPQTRPPATNGGRRRLRRR